MVEQIKNDKDYERLRLTKNETELSNTLPISQLLPVYPELHRQL